MPLRVLVGALLLILILAAAPGAIDEGPAGIVVGVVLMLVLPWRLGPWPRGAGENGSRG